MAVSRYYDMKGLIRFLTSCIGVALILYNFGALLALSLSIHLGAGLADAVESISPSLRTLAYGGGTAILFLILIALVSAIGAIIGYGVGRLFTALPLLWRRDTG